MTFLSGQGLRDWSGWANYTTTGMKFTHALPQPSQAGRVLNGHLRCLFRVECHAISGGAILMASCDFPPGECVICENDRDQAIRGGRVSASSL